MDFKQEVVEQLLYFRGHLKPSRLARANAVQAVDSCSTLVGRLEVRGVSPFHACMEVEREIWKSAAREKS